MLVLKYKSFKLDQIDGSFPGLLYISGAAPAWVARRAGITHSVVMCYEEDKWTGKGMKDMLHAYTPDDGLDKSVEYWNNIINFGGWALKDHRTRLWVHCRAGVNRSAGAVYGILRGIGVRPELAWEMVSEARPCVKSRYVEQIERLVFGNES